MVLRMAGEEVAAALLRASAALEKVSPQRRFFLLSVISNIFLIFCASQSAAFGWLQTAGLICLKHQNSEGSISKGSIIFTLRLLTRTYILLELFLG